MKTHSFALTLLVVLLSSALFGQKYERYKKLVDTTIVSKNLGFRKNISITVPIEWQKNNGRNFPLIVVFDRQNQRSHNYILNTIDYITSNEQMPSSIIVSIESKDEYRSLETLHKASNKNGLAEENELFLFEELIPLLEKEYKASSFRVLIGHSRYGYFTTSLLATRINQLNAVVAISPFFTQDNVNFIDSLSVLQTQKMNHQKFYRFSVGGDFPDDFHKMDSFINLQNIDNFNAKGISFPEADHNVTPGLTIGTALYEIFYDWSKIQNKYLDNNIDLTVFDSLEKEILSCYGSNLKFSLGVLNGKGWFFYSEEHYENAIKAWEILLKSYPNFSEAYLFIIDAQIHLKQDYSKTVEKLKISLRSTDFYSKKDKQNIMNELKGMTK